MMPVNYNNFTRQAFFRKDMRNCRVNFRHNSFSVSKLPLPFVVDEEVNLIIYCASGVSVGLLIILAIFIGFNLAKAKKSLDEHMRLR